MKRELTLKIGGQEVTVTASRDGQKIVVERGEAVFTVEMVAEKVIGSQVASTPPPMPMVNTPAANAPTTATASSGMATTVKPAGARAGGGPPAGGSGGPGAVRSPMTGVVDQVLVQEGATVAEGEKIVILEAMKMYIDVTAHISGIVSAIAVKTGDSVKEGRPLMTIG